MSRNHFKINKGVSLGPVAAQPIDPENGDLIYNSTTSQFEKYEGGVWKTLGSGSGGSVNLITNGNADEAATSIFTPYADAAATRPVDGDGGSPTVTTSISAVSPLTGTKSFLLTKPASNTQGQGWAVSSFAMDQSYRTKSLKISVDYIVNSGTFVAGSNNGTPTDGDLIWYIYDITNSQLIEPSNIKMFSSNTTISDKFEATFQTSVTGSSYRLIAHCASTSALAYEIKVDNVTVTPQVYVYGTPVTDWQEYTPTFTGLGTVSSTQMLWRQVGDSIEIAGRTTVGTSTATGVSFSLPGGVSVHSGFTNTQIVGYADRSAGASTYIKTWSLFSSSNATTISLGNIDANASLDPLVAVVGTSVATTGQVLLFKADVKINGWSSSTRMSDSYDGRVIVAKATLALSTFATTINTVVKVPFDVVNIDSVNGFSSGSYTVKSAGKYRSSGRISTAVNTGTGELIAQLYKNGASVEVCANTKSGAANQPADCNYEFLFDCNVGDVLELYVFQNLVAGLTLRGNNIGLGVTCINIEKIQGPQAIAASEPLAVFAKNSSGQVIPISVQTTVTGWTKTIDTHGAFNASTGIFTFPSAMILEVAVGLTFNDIFGNGDRLIAIFNSIGSVNEAESLRPFNTAASGQETMTATALIAGVAGSTVNIKAFQSSTGALSLNPTLQRNFLSIRRVG